LWEQAVAVAGQEGVYRTAHTLHLDYANLKRRVEAAEAVTTAITPDKRKASRRSDHILSLTANRASEPPAFIEILSDTIASECLIEVEGAGGRMRIQMKLSAPEVMNLVRDWRARE
jgi:hypothetical protein